MPLKKYFDEGKIELLERKVESIMEIELKTLPQ